MDDKIKSNADLPEEQGFNDELEDALLEEEEAQALEDRGYNLDEDYGYPEENPSLDFQDEDENVEVVETEDENEAFSETSEYGNEEFAHASDEEDYGHFDEEGEVPAPENFKDKLLAKLKGMIIPLLAGTGLLIYTIVQLMGLFSSPEPVQSLRTTKQFSEVKHATPAVGVIKPAAPAKEIEPLFKTDQEKPSPRQPKVLAQGPAEQKQAAPSKQPPVLEELKHPAKVASHPTANEPAGIKSPQEPKIISQAPPVVKQPSIETIIPPAPTLSNVDQPLAVPVASPAPTLLQTDIGKMEALIQAVSKENQANNKQLQTLAAQSEKISQTLVKMGEAINLLAGELKRQKEILKSQKLSAPPSQKANKNKPKGVAKAAESYYVQAIIPGQAWLKNVEGNLITIQIGTLIPGAGKVTVINAEKGFIRTNSGRTFEYAIETN